MKSNLSTLSKLLFSDERQKKIILDKLKKSEPIIGTTVTINDIDYIITVAETGKIIKRVNDFKNELNREFNI